MIDPNTLSKQLTAGMPDVIRRKVICEWLRDEMKSRSGLELAHYLTGYVYDMINPGFVLTLKFPFDPGFLDPAFGNVAVQVKGEGE